MKAWVQQLIEPTRASGPHAQTSLRERRRIRIANTVALLGATIAVLSIPFDLVVAPWWMLIEDVVGFALFMLAIGCSRNGRPTAAKLIVILAGNGMMIWNAVSMGRNGGSQLVFFALAILPFMVFGERQRRLRVVVIALPVAAYAFFELWGFAFFAQHMRLFTDGTYTMYSAGVTFVTLIVSVRYVVRSNQLAETALRTSEAHYRTITDTAQDAILAVDGAGLLTFASPAGGRLFGAAPARLIGRPLDELLPTVADAATPGARVGVHPQRGTFPVEISTGESHGTRTLIVRDVSERVRIQAQLDEARGRSLYAARLAALGEMSSGVAHEINNPLTALMLAAESLLRNAEDEGLDAAGVRYTAQRIQRITGRIDKIVNALRFFARDAEGDPMSRMPVKQLVDDTLELCAERFRKHQIELRVTPVAAELHLECRGVQIAQVLLNLLSNAHDAVVGKPGAWVSLDVAAQGDELVFTVTDCNPGIAAELQEKIFQPFFTTKKVGQGTGLGLSVSYGIVQDHAGRIELDAAAANTRFVVALPLRQAG